MKRFSKLVAVPVGAAITAIATPFLMSLLMKLSPEAAADPGVAESLRYLIFAIITGGAVYAAPANTPPPE